MYDPMHELEHYGVLGMKWGVRRTPAQLGHRQEKKLNRYKEKEIGKVEKRMARSEEAENRRRKAYRNTLKDLKRQAKKEERENPDELIYETMMKQLYPSAKEQYRDMKEFDSLVRLEVKNNRKEAHAEIDAIKKMSYKDMKKEKAEVGKQAVKTSLKGFGELSLALLNPRPGLPTLRYITESDPSRTKTDMRLQQGRYARK